MTIRLLGVFAFVVVIHSDEGSCEGERLSVGSEDGGVDVTCGREEDSDRYKDDTEDGCHGGDEELYFVHVRGLTASLLEVR